MGREWNMIDVLRMEKFLLLVRRYVGASFGVMKEGEWEEGLVASILEVMAEVPLNVEDMKVPVGLRFHVIDIWVDELERVGALGEEEEDVDERTLEVLMEPLRKLGSGSPNKTVRIKAREACADERLPANRKEGGEEESVEVGAGDEWGGIEG
ncbi:hypothetical protein G7Y89_g4207 [Cudoniella acicularis]|uniref:Uncharacterized protein n=1 Tax=Cudoniella acicularis TaxID=354080 RepID=A0A8H4RPX3_9HELO|nr:hypothetical protein G7Y89_g4207 [Cudoniella acicularis]